MSIPDALIGLALGLACGAFGAYTLYAIIKLLRDAANQNRVGIALTVLAFFVKFPVLGIGAYLSFRLGTVPLICFLAGVLVVYSALVWRAFRHGFYPQ
jgi:hypothetical protein